MKVVKVYGALKKRLGQGTFKLDVNTPAEAIKALCINFPWLVEWLTESKDNGVGYKILLGKEKINSDNMNHLLLPWSEKEVFKITPVVTGAGGGGGWKILGGIALIGLAFVTGGASFAWSSGLTLSLIHI